MSPGVTFAVLTVFTGVMLLLGWLYATADNPRSGSMLGKSFFFFAVPIMLAPVEFFQFPLGIWALVACEEALKAFGSTREQNRVDKFWFVCLFGIWELTVDKPFWGFVVAQSGESWGHLAIVGLVYSTALPVLMHAVTAAIYAFTFEGRLWAAILTSWVVHTAFNEAVDYFGLSPMAAVIETTILGIILFGILSRQKRLAAIEVR